MQLSLIAALVFLIALALVYRHFGLAPKPSQPPSEIDEKLLAEAEADLKANADDTQWVFLKRLSGPGYSHASIIDLIAKLEAAGVEATYENIASSSAEMGVTNFMIKVRPGFEAQALAVLSS